MAKQSIKEDIGALNNMKTCFNNVGHKYGVPPSTIGGIASRESRGGRLLVNTDGYGDNGKAYGIMQCDLKTSGLNCKEHAWNSCGHVEAMVRDKLVPDIQRVAAKHPDWSKDQQLQGGVAAYNFGVKNVQTWEGLDRGTTGNNYSSDVMGRARVLRNEYGWDK